METAGCAFDPDNLLPCFYGEKKGKRRKGRGGLTNKRPVRRERGGENPNPLVFDSMLTGIAQAVMSGKRRRESGPSSRGTPLYVPREERRKKKQEETRAGAVTRTYLCPFFLPLVWRGGGRGDQVYFRFAP